MADDSPLEALWKFAFHVVGGAAAAVVVALVAIGLNLGAQAIETDHLLPAPFVWAIYGLEYFIFGADVLCLVWHVVREARKFLGI